MPADELERFGAEPSPPATDAQIQELEKALGHPLPPELQALYREHNGLKEPGALPLWLMSTKESAKTNRTMRRDGFFPEELRFFWTDDQSTYAALYVTGPAAGRVCVIEHEEPDPSPVFRSVASFYQAMYRAAEAGQDAYELLHQPGGPETEGTPEEQAADLALSEEYAARVAAESDPEKRRSLAFAAMQLLPPSEAHRLLGWLRSDDMWIQERACELLGRRRLVEAIPALAEIARNGMHNGRVAALTALREFGAPAAEVVARLRKELEPQWQIYLKQR
jgi:hypothetical protein